MATNTATAVLQLDETTSCEMTLCSSLAVDPLNIPTDHISTISPADTSTATATATANSDNKDKLFDLEQCSSTRAVFTDVIEIGDGEEEESSKRKKSKKESKQSKEQTKRNTPKSKAGRPSGSGTKSPNLSNKLDPLAGKSTDLTCVKAQNRNNSAKSNKSGAIVSRRLSTPAGQTAVGKYSNPSSVSSVSTDSKSASPSPKPSFKQTEEEERIVENSGPKVPPLKIVIPGGISSGTSQMEGDSGNRKGKSARSSLPHKKCSVSISLEATSNITDNILDKESELVGQAGEGVPDGQTGGAVASLVREERSSAVVASTSTAGSSSSTTINSTTNDNNTTNKAPVKLPPRKRKVKTSKEHHADTPAKVANAEANATHANANSFQMYFNIRKQVERRQKSVFPVQPKPPKGFKDYLMNRCSYVLQKNAKVDPTIDFPPTLPPPMRDQFTAQEKERHSLRVQHQVEKEKLVLAVEQEILRVHGRAARALANQALPFSLCTFLRGREVYNMLTPEQEEKERNTQRPRYNGRLFLSWLQEVDDKWEKIKEGMVRRHHNEAESLHAVQTMDWQWKLDELNLCDSKMTPRPVAETSHVPMVLVSEDFDLLPD